MNSLTPKTAPSGILPCVGVRVPTGYVTKAPAWSPISVTPHSSVAQTAGPQVADASVSPTSLGFSNVFVRGASFFPLWQLCSEEVCDHSFGISSRTSNVHDGRKGNNCFCSAVAAAACVLAVIQGPPAGSTASAWQRLLSLLTGRGGGREGLAVVACRSQRQLLLAQECCPFSAPRGAGVPVPPNWEEAGIQRFPLTLAKG